MDRDDDLKNLWRELNQISEAKDEEEKEAPAENLEAEGQIEALLSRLEDIVSRLEDALGKKEADKEAPKEDEEEEPKKEGCTPRRIRRPLRSR